MFAQSMTNGNRHSAGGNCLLPINASTYRSLFNRRCENLCKFFIIAEFHFKTQQPKIIQQKTEKIEDLDEGISRSFLTKTNLLPSVNLYKSLIICRCYETIYILLGYSKKKANLVCSLL